MSSSGVAPWRNAALVCPLMQYGHCVTCATRCASNRCDHYARARVMGYYSEPESLALRDRNAFQTQSLASAIRARPAFVLGVLSGRDQPSCREAVVPRWLPHEFGREERERDRHIDLSNAAFIPRSDLLDTGDGAGNHFIKPAPTTRSLRPAWRASRREEVDGRVGAGKPARKISRRRLIDDLLQTFRFRVIPHNARARERGAPSSRRRPRGLRNVTRAR
jgi:hypothetical protein